ncbi:MAG TPA: Crp/Fnr family transcriptional regulator [Solirubrobacteraceae bacterium]
MAERALMAPLLSARDEDLADKLGRSLGDSFDFLIVEGVPVILAPLGARFRAAARRWPGMSDVLLDRLARQTHRASMHLAMLHLPRVEDRIVALFSDLAERFGHVTSVGILIDLDLTHEIIGGLVASRRPTVSIALQALADEGRLVRRDDKRLGTRPDRNVAVDQIPLCRSLSPSGDG